MSLSTAAVDTFLIEHPTYDGRGVLILIFDTGVDPSIPGLQVTTTGTPKIIDAIDYSESNVIDFVLASVEKRDGEEILRGDGITVELEGFNGISPQPIDGLWYIGMMDESRYQNASVRDFDGDGMSQSYFGALLYQVEDGWRVILDTDGDGDVSDERGVQSFSEGGKAITFVQEYEEDESPLTLSASVDGERKRASFHYDMGGHGTHVAGIAAGYNINGEEGFNGVAPGAQLISVKFSGDFANDNTITGSMKRAYEYAARLADSLANENVPVVVNMSFGIGSAYEGKASIEQFLDTLIPKHPNLYVVTSAGNAGPGLSSVGLPAAAAEVISVGALLPLGIARDAYSSSTSEDIVWDFSSRGGEVDKPDVLAPGTAISTIPRFSFDMRASGTSMASPYTAGVVALLLSAAGQEYPGWVPTQGLIRRVLRQSAVPLEDYALSEQGGGVVHVKRAYDLLRDYKRSGYAENFEDYIITTTSPNYPDQTGPTAFWRSGYIPDEESRQKFTIQRRIPDNDEAVEEFFRAYTLESTVPWMRTIQKTVYINDDNSTSVEVVYDREQLKEPGLYDGKVIARRSKGRKRTGLNEVEFELLNTIIVPHRFSAAENFTITTDPVKLRPGMTKRFYFELPGGACAATFSVNVPKDSKSILSGWIVDRHGEIVNYLPHVKASERAEGNNTVPISELGDGIIEVIVQADPYQGGGGESEFTLTVEPLMLDLGVATRKIGKEEEVVVKATNKGTEPLDGSFDYTIKGYGRTLYDTIRGDYYRLPLTMNSLDGALWISPSFTPEDYMLSTDILARIVDSSGVVQAEEVFNSPEEWLFLPNFLRGQNSTGYFLEIIFGSADYRNVEEQKIPIAIIEKHVRPTDYEKVGNYMQLELFPNIPQTLIAPLIELEGGVPQGYNLLGELRYKPRSSKGSNVSIDFEINR